MKKNSTVKSFIKKVVSRSPRSASYSHVFFRLTSICLCLAVAVSAMAIPASAETELVKITLTAEDLYNLFSSNYIAAESNFFQVSNGGATIYPFNDIQHPINLTDSDFFFPAEQSQLSFFVANDSLYIYFPYLLYPSQFSSYTVILGTIFPFPYFLSENDEISVSLFSFSNSVIWESGVEVVSSSSDSESFIFNNVSSSSVSWSDVPYSNLASLYPDLSSIFPAFNSSYRQDLTTTITSNIFVDSLTFLFAYIGEDTPVLSAVPLMFSIDPIDIWVESEIEPDINEYLDAIAGPPTAENQTKINNLKQKFETIDSDLEQSAQDMKVEIPDISNKLDTLPQEVVQGNSMVSTNIYTPMLNIPFLTSIFTALFCFLALKLILHGGGNK